MEGRGGHGGVGGHRCTSLGGSTRLNLSLGALRELLEDIERLSDLRERKSKLVRPLATTRRKTHLGSEGLLVLEQVEELGRVHLEEHAGDLSGEVGLRAVDLGVETVRQPQSAIKRRRGRKKDVRLSEHLLLLLGRSVGEDGGGQARTSDGLLSVANARVELVPSRASHAGDGRTARRLGRDGCLSRTRGAIGGEGSSRGGDGLSGHGRATASDGSGSAVGAGSAAGRALGRRKVLGELLGRDLAVGRAHGGHAGGVEARAREVAGSGLGVGHGSASAGLGVALRSAVVHRGSGHAGVGCDAGESGGLLRRRENDD